MHLRWWSHEGTQAWPRVNEGCFLALASPVGCVTLGKLLNLSESLCLHPIK